MRKYQSIINKLVFADLKTNRFRSVFITLAVFFTTFLLGATLSLGVNFLENMRMEQFRQYGTMTNGAIGNPTEQQMEKMKQLDYITVTSHMIKVVDAIPSSKQAENINLEMWYADESEWSVMRSPTYTDIHGKYPQKQNEIMLSLRALKKMGIENPFTGMEIPITYSDLTGKNESAIFYLSGWYTDYQPGGAGQNIESAYVSEALCKQFGRSIDRDGVGHFLVTDPAQISTYLESLKTDLQLLENQPIKSSIMINGNTGEQNLIAFLGLLVAIFILSGYLIISNVLYISLHRDIQYYGSLKALGTTQKQIRNIVFTQVSLLCFIGILVGLLLTFILSSVLLPTVISALRNVESSSITSSYSQVIYPLAAVFAIVATLLGAFRPVKKIATISPVEAMKCVETPGRKAKRSSRRTGGSLLIMAYRNVFRDRKRTLIVIFSLFLGLSLFLVIQTLVLSMGTENTIQRIVESDIMISGDTSLVSDESASGWGVSPAFEDEFIEQLKTLPGVESVSIMANASTLLSNRDFFNRGVPSADEDIPDWVYGVDNEDIARLNQEYELDIDVDAFEHGDFAVVASEDPQITSSVKELWLRPIPIGKDEKDAATEYVKLPVGAWVPESFKNADGGSMLHPAIFVSNSYMKKIYGDAVVCKVYINASKEEETNVLASVKQMIQGNAGIKLVSRSEMREMFQGLQFVLNVVGGTISGIICIIGLLNFANAVLMGILSRKSEFATLESIGMTIKQVRKLLMLEGLCYATIALVLVWTVGNALALALTEVLKTIVTSAIYVNPIFPMVCVSVLVVAICMFLPLVLYRSFNKSTIAERVRETM